MEKTVVHAWSHGKTKFITQNLYQIHLAIGENWNHIFSLIVIGTDYIDVNPTAVQLLNPNVQRRQQHKLHSLSRVVVPATLDSISVNAHFTISM